MESVRHFNAELQSLYEAPPPISKAKMATITRAAMKSIKYYKHVVQSVEKFIQKCKPEYKIAALYIIDSIVRQSKHQFGTEKDVFAPRFTKNFETTFSNLFSRCIPDDKSKIIRVLNLWQKNNVFPMETIQPLFDLANPDHPIYSQEKGIETNSSINLNMQSPHFSKGEELGVDSHDKRLDETTIRQLQQFQQILIRQTAGETYPNTNPVKFNKKLLEYDYGEDEDEQHASSLTKEQIPDVKNLGQILSDPNVLKHLQNIKIFKPNENDPSRQEDKQNIIGKGHNDSLGSTSYSFSQMNACGEGDGDIEFVSATNKSDIIHLDHSNSRSSSPRHDRYRRKRSRSRDRKDRRRRSNSRSRSRSRSPRFRRRSEKEREREREYERERRRKGLPEIKKDHLSVCSTTLWVGHLSKLVQQEELSDTFGKYGEIISIDMIPPRGCAFIVMHRRQDAYKSMQALKNHKMYNRMITISWAAGKGVKSKEWKDYWDVELGVCYIPWSKISKSTDFSALEEGGMFDDDTVPLWMRDFLKTMPKIKPDEVSTSTMPYLPQIDTSQPPPSALPMIPLVNHFPMGTVPRLMAPLSLPMPPPTIGGVPILNVPPPQILLAPGQAMIPPLPGPLPPAGLNPFSVPPPSNPDIVHTQLMAESNQENSTNRDDNMDIDEDDRGVNTKRGDSFESSHYEKFNRDERNLQQNIDNKRNASRLHGFDPQELNLNDRRNDRDKSLQDRLRELAYANNRNVHERDFNRDFTKRIESGNNPSFGHKRDSKRFEDDGAQGNENFSQYHPRFKDGQGGMRMGGPQQPRFFPTFNVRGGQNFMRGNVPRFNKNLSIGDKKRNDSGGDWRNHGISENKEAPWRPKNENPNRDKNNTATTSTDNNSQKPEVKPQKQHEEEELWDDIVDNIKPIKPVEVETESQSVTTQNTNVDIAEVTLEVDNKIPDEASSLLIPEKPVADALNQDEKSEPVVIDDTKTECTGEATPLHDE